MANRLDKVKTEIKKKVELVQKTTKELEGLKKEQKLLEDMEIIKVIRSLGPEDDVMSVLESLKKKGENEDEK